MRRQLRISGVTAIAFVSAATALAPAAANAASGIAVQGASPIATPANEAGGLPSGESIEFDVGLQLRDRAGAVALENAVSSPSSASYRHFLTSAQWVARFSPTQAAVVAVSAWLRSQGVSVDRITPDRMTIAAHASRSTIERAFQTSLGEYRNHGALVRLSKGPLTVPASVAALISGVRGIDQHIA